MQNLSPINDDKDIVTKEYVDAVKSAAAVNRSTLGYQGKNVLKNENGTITKNGITFTLNSNGSITTSGTATAQTFLYFKFNKELVDNNEVVLSGCPSGGTENTYFMTIRYYNKNGSERYAFDLGSGVTLTPADTIQIILGFRSGVSADGLVFYPMLMDAKITDNTFEPYVPDINTRLLALEDKQAQSGALLAETAIGSSSGNITITDLASYSSVWAYIDGNVNGVTFATNVIIPIAYLAQSTSNSVKLAGGIPTAAYITSSGPQAPADTSGYITASVSGNTLSLSLSTATDVIGNVKIVAI